MKHLSLVAKGQNMHPRAIAEASGYSESTIKAWSRTDVEAATALEAEVAERAEQTAVADRVEATKRRPQYRNRNDLRINRNGYLDALQDIVAVLNDGRGEAGVLEWCRENGGGEVNMAATFGVDTW